MHAGTDSGFQVKGGALKKIAPSGGRLVNFGVFRVKNHDYTPKNHIFFQFVHLNICKLRMKNVRSYKEHMQNAQCHYKQNE